MYYADHRLAKAAMDIHLKEAQSLAQSRRLLHQAGAQPRGWLPRQACRLLGQVGERLVVLGERLEQYTLLQPSL